MQQNIALANGGEEIFAFELEQGGSGRREGLILQIRPVEAVELHQAAQDQRPVHGINIFAIDFQVIDQNIEDMARHGTGRPAAARPG